MIHKIERQIRILLGIFIACLAFSGITAFPLEWELQLLNGWAKDYLSPGHPVSPWINKVYQAVHDTNSRYPFIAYGTDWLAFSHLVIAVFFIGPFRNPGRDFWIIQSGMIACVMVIPLAFIAGEIRAIPIFWRLIDCSFGIIGIIPLWIVLKLSKRLARLREELEAAELYMQKGALARR